jgi:branched-chain amino acid transport system permease protein
MEFYSQIIQYLLIGLALGCIYGLVAIGYNIIFNATEIINFAQGDFLVLGGFIMISLNKLALFPLPVNFIITVIIVAATAAALERFGINKAKNPTVVNLIVICLAAHIIYQGAAMLIWGKESQTMRPFINIGSILIFGASLLPQFIWVFGVTAGIMIGLVNFYKRTMLGRAMLACSINRVAAGMMGINVPKMIFLGFVISAAVGAAGGIIITPITMVDYNVGLQWALKGFCALILGGVGNLYGAMLGGLLLGVMEQVGAGLISSAYKDAIGLIVLLLVLRVRPTGILGEEREHALLG